MRTLIQSLQDEDTGRLRIIAELWGFDLPQGTTRELLSIVLDRLRDPAFCQEIFESLPDPEQAALIHLRQHNNHCTTAELIRKFGEIRQIGPGRRDREKTWRSPISPLEALWYRGWIGAAFDHTPEGLQEFMFIPTELLQAVPDQGLPEDFIPGSKSEPPENIYPASSYLLEDCTTLLADIRRQIEGEIRTYLSSPEPDRFLIKPESKPFIIHLMTDIGILLPGNLQPDPEALKTWFASHPGNQRQQVIETWRDSITWNDLALVRSLTCHQENWPNNPILSRTAVLSFFQSVPANTWWDLDTFISSIHTHQPAFQRPVEDFDSWYLQSRADGTFLTGFSAWEAVEGALIRTILRGPLFWLGLVDLGTDAERRWITSFRIRPGFARLRGRPDDSADQPAAAPAFSTNGEISFPLNSDPTLRYQVARAAEWSGFDGKAHRYYFTPGSLQKSAMQGLSARQLLSLLQSSPVTIPPYIEKAVTQWENKMDLAGVFQVHLLRVDEPETITRLQKDRMTSRFLGEQLNPISILVRRTDLKKLYSAALRIGILLDIPNQEK